MKIVADENIPLVEQAFRDLANVIVRPGRSIGEEDLLDADALLVRSVTEVNEQLLGRSGVKFVGTATIGTEHVDEQYLRQRGIGFVSAPGSNANSVAEYVIAALLVLAARFGIRLGGRRIGVVGAGHVGTKVAEKTAALGMQALLNDPPLARLTHDSRYLPLEHLMDADFVTFHVPLTKSGQDATWHMVDSGLLNKLTPGIILLNTSRGAVVDSAALLRQLERGRVRAAVLDVWEWEDERKGTPRPVDHNLLESCALGTPHIAGYSWDGKVNATQMLHDGFCRFFGFERQWSAEGYAPAPPVSEWRVTERGHIEDRLADLVGRVYPLEEDDLLLRRTPREPAQAPAYFDALRKNYRVRREFSSTSVFTSDETYASAFRALGFSVRRE